ncbi:MAG: uroporphyrinogen decarboxylase family protein [bacterium]
MTSRERIRKAINHEEPDCIPVDLGSTPVTGIAASTYAKLRQALGLTRSPVKVAEPFQMLAEVELEVIEKLGVDTIGLQLPTTLFGFKNENWKPWRLFDGTQVLVPGLFITREDKDGNLLLYPGGDSSAPPSAKMPKGGYYFDGIVRQEAIDESRLDPQEWVKDQYSVYTDEELRYLEETAEDLYRNTDLSLVGSFWQGGFGDIALVPGLDVKHPKGIRDPQEWIIAHALHPEYIKGIFHLQCEIAVQNLKLYHEAVGDKIDVIAVSGTDFGTQNASSISPDMYRDLYKPFHKIVNEWIHENTPWKIFYHTCGSIVSLLDDLVETGVDILNPVQCSAAGMNPTLLKEKYGERLVFWGAGVDTQKTLPFGTPEEVRREVTERCRIFGRKGGFVFNAIHNIQPKTPTKNIIAMFEAVKNF